MFKITNIKKIAPGTHAFGIEFDYTQEEWFLELEKRLDEYDRLVRVQIDAYGITTA